MFRNEYGKPLPFFNCDESQVVMSVYLMLQMYQGYIQSVNLPVCHEVYNVSFVRPTLNMF